MKSGLAIKCQGKMSQGNTSSGQYVPQGKMSQGSLSLNHDLNVFFLGPSGALWSPVEVCEVLLSPAVPLKPCGAQ